MAGISGVLAPLVATNRRAFVTGSAAMALGLALGGQLIGHGMVQMKRADREVTVRGVAQRQVTANLARWQAKYSERAHDLPAALAAVDRDSALIAGYLKTQGFGGAEAKPGSAEVSVGDEMVDNKPTGRKVYAVTRTIAFTTANVAGVQQVQAHKDRLAEQGLVLDSVDASYEYTLVDRIKPDMIAEAAKDARRAAEKFAGDSDSTVGGIKSATQGYFSVTSRESSEGGDSEYGDSGRTASSPDQRVRVVTTIVYYLG
ncbi:MAG: SIMPL domain-containing protein [Sphingomonadales bacterium]|nr:SIMPL domain-containing protein [Sphingomonadales bacterium]